MAVCYVLLLLIAAITSIVTEVSNANITFALTCDMNHFNGTWTIPAKVGRTTKIATLDGACSITTTAADTSGNLAVGYAECGTVTTNDTTNIFIMNNTVRMTVTQELRNISKREYYYDYKLTCTMPRYQDISSVGSYTVSEIVVPLKTDTEASTFELKMEMSLYTDEAFGTKATSDHSVDSGHMIYVGLVDPSSSTQLKFIVNKCFTTPSASYSDSKQDVFFNDKCAFDDSFTDLTNGAASKYLFGFEAFWFTSGKAAMYLHCQVLVCAADSQSIPCIQKCVPNNRRRRAVPAEASGTNGEIDEYVITSREIKLDNTETCSTASPICPLNSKCYSIEPARCVCNDGYVFSRKTKTCTSLQRMAIEGIHLNQQWNDIYSNRSSIEYQKMAADNGDWLYRLISGNGADEGIEGVKVIGARKGSIILDIEIIYAETLTSRDAFHLFVNSIMKKTTRTTIIHRLLKINPDTAPVLVIYKVTENINRTEIIILVVVILAVLVMLFSFAVMYRIKRGGRRERGDDVTGYDNNGIDMNKK